MVVAVVVGMDDLAAIIDDGVFGRGASPFTTLAVVLVVVAVVGQWREIAERGRTRHRESSRRPRQEIRRREDDRRRVLLRGGGGGRNNNRAVVRKGGGVVVVVVVLSRK